MFYVNVKKPKHFRNQNSQVLELCEIEPLGNFCIRNFRILTLCQAKKAALDAIRLAEEARIQQDRAEKEESEKRTIEATIKELQIR